MPTSTIPYDPSLVLGMIVEPDKITQLQEIADAQVEADLARDHFDALLRQKLSLDMTMRELVSLGATMQQLEQLDKQIQKLTGDVVASAQHLAEAVMASASKVAEIKSRQGQKQIGTQLQSPVDFGASELKGMPLSADSMNMDVQYFRYESNEQQSRAGASSISSFVGTKVSGFLGPTVGASAGAAAHQASTSAVDHHGVFGTLVICANCTSREAQVFSPLKLDVDAAVDSFVFYKQGNELPVETWEDMKTLATTPPKAEDQASAMPVIVGATYGSSFVGFVHFEKTDASESSQSSSSVSAQVRGEVETDMWFESVTGSFGLDAQSSRSLKQMLSTNDIQSHCSVITMGLIPTIKSNQVKTVVKSLKDDPKELMTQLAAMQGASDASVASLAAGAADAKRGQSIEQMKSDFISSSVSAVSDVDEATNQVIDLNSLMVALDDYVQKAGEGKIGVPINYYLKYVTKRDIALEWMEKYYPDKLHEKDDDKDDSGS